MPTIHTQTLQLIGLLILLLVLVYAVPRVSEKISLTIQPKVEKFKPSL